MGLAASQVRFLQLTGRKYDIGRQLQHLSMEKMDLTRDMQKVTKNYRQALCKKSPKLTFNMGVTYSDISYNALMSPNEYNSKSPIMITNNAGRIIIDEKYKKYAEMISPDGSIGGIYNGETREKILQELTGITPEKMKAFDSTSEEVQKAADAVNDALEARDSIKTLNFANTDDFIKKFLNKETLGITDSTLTLDNIATIMNKIGESIIGKNYFSPEQESAFSETLGELGNFYINSLSEISAEASQKSQKIKNQLQNSDSIFDVIKYLNGDYSNDINALNTYIENNKISVDDFISGIVSGFRVKLGEPAEISVFSDKDGNGIYDKYAAAEKVYQDALNAYKEAINQNGQVYNAPEKTQIEYYDALFNSIVDNGWTYDGSVGDSEYLSQMFQNNQYFVMTVEKNECFDPDSPESIRNYEYTYTTDLATNFKNIVFVNDSDAREEALVNYEYEKGKINSKESQIDQRMTNLKTEEQAINKMLESIEKVKEDNIEGTFGLWA